MKRLTLILTIVIFLMVGWISILRADTPIKLPSPENVTERFVGWLCLEGGLKIPDIGDRISVADDSEDGNLIEGQVIEIPYPLIWKIIWRTKHIKVIICLCKVGEYCCATPVPLPEDQWLSREDKLELWWYDKFGKTLGYYDPF